VNYFSIDDAIEQIKYPYTKELFKEVHSSYAMGNYRSAVVMLWSVVVTDLVLKLKELESVYSDETATRILDDIKKEQDKDPTSSKWEMKIVENFQKELNFFESHEVTKLVNLQNMRHISAHPVITGDDLLFTPDKYEVFGIIKNAMCSVLIKEALFSSKVKNYILDDLDVVKTKLTEYDDVKKYFIHKFLNNMSNVVLIKLIKTLWDFSFRKTNPKIDENRKINLMVLRVIFEERKDVLLNFMSSESRFISNLNLDDALIKSFFRFIIDKKHLLEYFEPEAIEIIKALVKEDYSLFEYLVFKSPSDYMAHIIESDYFFMPVPSLKILRKDCKEANVLGEYLDMCINGYSKSTSYDQADSRFKSQIQPNLQYFTLDKLRVLVDKSNRNSQVFARDLAKDDHKLVIERILSLDNDFDFRGYRNFIKRNLWVIKPASAKTAEEVEEIILVEEE